MRYARIDEKRKVYEWLCLSDTTELHLGVPDFPECPVPTWEQFLAEFQDYYFLESGRNRASVMIIENKGVEVGCVCYEMFYVYEQKAVLMIWLNSKNFLGKGYGTKALKLTMDYLNKNYSVKEFLIRPSVKNLRAIRAYQKIGFERVPEENKRAVINEFIKPEFMESCFEGDYGFDGSAIMIKYFK